MLDSMEGVSDPGSFGDWGSLPVDILTAIFGYLPQKDRGTARRVCRAWAQQALQDATHVHKPTELTKQAASFLAAHLPGLESLSLQHASSLYQVHVLTQLTCLETLRPSYVPDLQPLTDLPNLRKLRLESCELGRSPCFGQLTQLKEVAVVGCQQSSLGVTETDAMLQSLLTLPLDHLQFSHPLISQSLRPLQDMVRSFEHVKCLTRLQALALVGAQPVKLQHLSELTQLKALSLAGLQKMPAHEPRGDADMQKALQKLRSLRVLDVRHAHALPHNAILALPALRLLALHDPASSQLVGKGPWMLHARVDQVALAQADDPLLAQNKRARLRNIVLQQSKRTGQNTAQDAQDAAHLGMFDDFWRMHVKQAVFDAPNLEHDYDDGDDWDDPFMEDEAGYGYMEDAFNIMDEADDADEAAAMGFLAQEFEAEGMAMGDHMDHMYYDHMVDDEVPPFNHLFPGQESQN